MEPDPTALDHAIRPGELRFARDVSRRRLPSGVHARLVLLVEVVEPDVVVCLLVTEDVDIAGSADLILGERETGLDARLCVQVDLAVSLALSQLGPAMTRLDEAALGVVLQTFADGEIPTGPTADGIARGMPLGTPADPRWERKLAELEDVRVLGEAVAGRVAALDDERTELRFPDDIEHVVILWETTLMGESRLAEAVRSTAVESTVVDDFELNEQVFDRLVGRSRRPHEALPTLRVRFVADPARVQVRLVVDGALSDAVRGIVVVVTGASGEARVALDLDRRDDPVFDGELVWSIGGAGGTAAVRVEVTWR